MSTVVYRTVQFTRQLFPIFMMRCGITYLRVVFTGMIKLLYCIILPAVL